MGKHQCASARDGNKKSAQTEELPSSDIFALSNYFNQNSHSLQPATSLEVQEEPLPKKPSHYFPQQVAVQCLLYTKLDTKQDINGQLPLNILTGRVDRVGQIVYNNFTGG